MSGYTTTMCSIAEIRPGDTVIHEGAMRTVCRSNLKRGFMGLTLFGDSYCSGLRKVERVTFVTFNKGDAA